MMEDKLVNLAMDALAILIPVLAAFLIELMRRYMGTEKMRKIQEELAAKQELATLAVRFTQQAYQDLHGPDKYQKAAEWLSVQAQSCGLKLSPDEVEGLIEATLRQIKDTFGEEWAKAAAPGGPQGGEN